MASFTRAIHFLVLLQITLSVVSTVIMSSSVCHGARDGLFSGGSALNPDHPGLFPGRGGGLFPGRCPYIYGCRQDPDNPYGHGPRRGGGPGGDLPYHQRPVPGTPPQNGEIPHP